MAEGQFPLVDVLKNGLCIGCGACFAFDKRVAVVWNDQGFLEANFLEAKFGEEVEKNHAIFLELCRKVCPFSGNAANEDELGNEFFSSKCSRHSAELGWFIKTYVGAVVDPTLRRQSSSGGIGRWLLQKLISGTYVDACAHVIPGAVVGDDNLFCYHVSHDAGELTHSAQSAYYPVTLKSVLELIEQEPGRYAVTALPCFVKAIRLLQLQSETFRERIPYVIGLFCGHLKSRFYAEMLAWQMNVPGTVKAVTFRDKSRAIKANEKGFVVWTAEDNKQHGPRTISDLFGASYNLGLFQHKACDYCDDVVAELADVSIGDAWLPEYISDPLGTSLVVVRDPLFIDMLEEGRARGELWIEPISPLKVVESQSGGFRHRREGLAYRLYLNESSGIWYPPKRIRPSAAIPRLRRKIYLMRLLLREESFNAFRKAKMSGEFEVFRAKMQPLINRYISLYRPSLLERILRKLRSIFF